MKVSTVFALATMLSVVSIFGCVSSDTSKTERNKQLFVQGIDAVNNRNWDALDSQIVANYVRHCQATPDVQVNSLDDFKRYLKQDSAAFPDSRVEIVTMVAEGDFVAFHCRYTATQRGPMGPFPATGKKMSLEVFGIHRIENGKLVETWLSWDNLSALMQLGLFPPGPQAGK